MKFIALFLLLFITFQAGAQNEPPLVATVEPNGLHDTVDIYPTFPGGMGAYERYLVRNIRYPIDAANLGIQGTVYLSVVVTEAGKITDVQILKDIGGGCGAEAKRVVENMPDWTPGKIKGEPVKVRTSIRIKFTLGSGFENPQSEEGDLPQDRTPKFPGGDEALSSYITKNLVVPDVVSSEKIDDYALVAFSIDENGLVKNARLLKRVPHCNECGKNAVNVIKDMPAWSPGVFHGRYETMEPELKIWFSYKSSSGSDLQEPNSTWEVLPDSNGIYEIVDKDPAFPGGQDEYDNYFAKSVRYPEEALKNRIEGTVYLSVVITETGEITDVKVLKDIGGGCGAEAQRVVEAMPHWVPGVYNGNPVSVRTTVRVKFTLQDDGAK